MTQLRFALVFHNHQPIGNFDGVIEQAYQDSYLPFLDVFDELHVSLQISLHTSGSLIEWLAQHHPEYLDRVAELVAAGRIEIVGGAFYEPILPMIPRRDRVGQIKAYTDLAGTPAWAARSAACGCPNASGNSRWPATWPRPASNTRSSTTSISRTPASTEEELHGYYVTEDEGQHPGRISRQRAAALLRFRLPTPQQTIDYLGQIAQSASRLGCGFWRRRREVRHLARNEEACLRKRLVAAVLRQVGREPVVDQGRRRWREAIDNVPPTGKIYLPDASYREMTEWALPADQLSSTSGFATRWSTTRTGRCCRSFVQGGYLAQLQGQVS